MPLANARVKAVEDMPEWARCCDEMIRRGRNISGRVVVVDYGISESRDLECMFCGNHHGLVLAILCTAGLFQDGPHEPGFVAVDALDIQEGEYHCP